MEDSLLNPLNQKSKTKKKQRISPRSHLSWNPILDSLSTVPGIMAGENQKTEGFNT